MADATTLMPPSPGLSATLLSNKRVEPYSSKGPENVKIKPDAAVEDSRKLHTCLKWPCDHFMNSRAGQSQASSENSTNLRCREKSHDQNQSRGGLRTCSKS